MKKICAALALGLVSCVAFATERDFEAAMNKKHRWLQFMKDLTAQDHDQLREIKESIQNYENVCDKWNIKQRLQFTLESPPSGTLSQNDSNSDQDKSCLFSGTKFERAVHDIDVLNEDVPWMKATHLDQNEEVAAAFERVKLAVKKESTLGLLILAARLEFVYSALYEFRTEPDSES